MEYTSTRSVATRTPQQVLLGLPDPQGGLYVPARWPDLTAASSSEGYAALVAQVAAPFLAGVASPAELEAGAQAAYERFAVPEVVPLVEVEEGLFLMQLFWGPTLAFKDLALQFLAGLIEAAAGQAEDPILVLGATSGDTGAAAIEAFRRRPGVKVAILHPHGMVTDVQRRFMTTTGDTNVANLAVEGTFDDCQRIVKELLARPEKLSGVKLASANSINFMRIVGQIAYYAAACALLGEARFSVPTGNFGNAYSGLVARKCGVPVAEIVVANNRNRAVSDLLADAWISEKRAKPTLSPAMDIRLPSNFERAVFEAFDRDVERVRAWIADERRALAEGTSRRMREGFITEWVSEEETLDAIADHYRSHRTLIDPHTAVALAAARKSPAADSPTVVLATAHPAKFPETVSRATGTVPAMAESFQAKLARDEEYEVVPADTERITDRLSDQVGA